MRSAERDLLSAIFRRDNPERNAYIADLPEGNIVQHHFGDYTISDKPISAFVPWIIADYQRQVKHHKRIGDDAVPMLNISTGTHIYAEAFGSECVQLEDQNAFAKPIVTTPEEVNAIGDVSLDSARALNRVLELAEALRSEVGPDVAMNPPDMQTGFDTACLVWNKADLFTSLYDDEGGRAVEHLANRCATLLMDFIALLRHEFPQMSPCHCPFVWCPPDLGPWVSNDEAGNISRVHYDRFCHGELMEMAKRFGSIGMHCCADAEHQFERFQDVPGLYAFNRVSASRGYNTLIDYFSEDVAKPVFVLGWISEAEKKQLLSHYRNPGRFIFKCDFETSDEAAAWLDRSRRFEDELRN